MSVGLVESVCVSHKSNFLFNILDRQVTKIFGTSEHVLSHTGDVSGVRLSQQQYQVLGFLFHYMSEKVSCRRKLLNIYCACCTCTEGDLTPLLPAPLSPCQS